MQNRVVLKNFLYVYKNFSVHDSFAELARDYYLADVRTVARPGLEVMRTEFSQDAVEEFDRSTDNSGKFITINLIRILVFFFFLRRSCTIWTNSEKKIASSCFQKEKKIMNPLCLGINSVLGCLGEGPKLKKTNLFALLYFIECEPNSYSNIF